MVVVLDTVVVAAPEVRGGLVAVGQAGLTLGRAGAERGGDRVAVGGGAVDGLGRPREWLPLMGFLSNSRTLIAWNTAKLPRS